LETFGAVTNLSWGVQKAVFGPLVGGGAPRSPSPLCAEERLLGRVYPSKEKKRFLWGATKRRSVQEVRRFSERRFVKGRGAVGFRGRNSLKGGGGNMLVSREVVGGLVGC